MSPSAAPFKPSVNGNGRIEILEESTSESDNDHGEPTTKKRKQKIDYNQMATVKRPKKHFASDQDREFFVKQYMAKLKTEMCRNWELTGRC